MVLEISPLEINCICSGMTVSLKFSSVMSVHPHFQECCIRWHWHLGSMFCETAYGLQKTLVVDSQKRQKDVERETGFAFFTILSRAVPNLGNHEWDTCDPGRPEK